MNINSRYFNWSANALCFAIIFLISFYTLDPDFGWHLMSGMNIIAHGIPKTDIFTFTASSYPWINHEWLNDTLIAYIYQRGGYASLALIFSALWMLSIAIAGRNGNLLVLFLAVFSLLSFAGIRPITWTVLFVAILERTLESKNTKTKYFIPCIFLIWANLHGGFAFGLLLLTIHQLFFKSKIPWLLFAASALATLINPYGIRIYSEILTTVLDPQLKYEIAEWEPLYLPLKSMVCFVLLMSLHFMFAEKPWRKIFSIPGLTLLMAFSSIRHFPLFIITSLRYFEKYADDLTPFYKANRKSVAWVGMIIFVFLTGHTIRATLSSHKDYLASTVQYLKTNPCEGNIFNSYNFGGYLIWKLPQYKVYIDGRMPSWKLDNIKYLNNYQNFLYNDVLRREQTEKHNIKCILLTSYDATNKMYRKNSLLEQLQEEGWTYIKEAGSEKTFLLIKNERNSKNSAA